MSQYATLKAAIQNVVKTNGNNEITGELLQQSLLAMIDSLGAYYQFCGVATPDTNPGTPDQNVFYIANAGTYPNFSGLVIPNGHIGVLKYSGTWAIETVQAGDVNAVKFVAQSLTNTQKVQARTNIEAASNERVSQLENEVHNLSGKFYGVFTSSSALPEGDAVGYAFVGSTNPYAIWNYDGSEWSNSGSVANGITGEPGVGFSSIFTPQPYDGTMIIVLSNNDTITVNLNHLHHQYLKYEMLQSESDMPANPDSTTLYMWPLSQ